MILLAFIPPLWRAVMHPRLEAHRRRPEQAGQVFRWGPTPAVAKHERGSACPEADAPQGKEKAVAAWRRAPWAAF
eukprot:CAMPEP_0198562562 /NCGR_PEP_ID=MMETSP1462-20131121/97363_1 /TAXON_ID=1333877 /ORGANISM="Brandtodinium nutriculum, Strain RCC3387" /LENGTH=74 /DNA_ID=CAMNT_0044293495 /DNA_START=9 /DNA_END=233 /DNA_ORIENTATION=+